MKRFWIILFLTLLSFFLIGFLYTFESAKSNSLDHELIGEKIIISGNSISTNSISTNIENDKQRRFYLDERRARIELELEKLAEEYARIQVKSIKSEIAREYTRLKEEIKRTGNFELGKIERGSDTLSIEVSLHSYNILHSLEEVKKLKNTTTYVLFPKNISLHSNQESKIYKRYLGILKLIQEMQKVDITLDSNAKIRKKQNEFILFQKEDSTKHVTIDNYNYEISQQILNFFEEKHTNTLFNQDGPYFITTAENIWNKDTDFSFLYVNLSKYNDSSIKEVLESYTNPN